MAVVAVPGRFSLVVLATTLVQLSWVGSRREVAVTAPSTVDIYLCDGDNVLVEGGALPADGYVRIAAGTTYVYPLAPGQTRVLLASVSGTPTAYVRVL